MSKNHKKKTAVPQVRKTLRMVTANRNGDQLFLLTDNNLQGVAKRNVVSYSCNPYYDLYQWRYGINPPTGSWWDSMCVGDLAHAVNNSSSCDDTENIHTWRLCWVSIPTRSVAKLDGSKNNLAQHVYCDRLYIQTSKTIDEIRKTDLRLYSQLIACLLYYGVLNSFQHLTMMSELECVLYILGSNYHDSYQIEIADHNKTPNVRLAANILVGDLLYDDLTPAMRKRLGRQQCHDQVAISKCLDNVNYKKWTSWTADQLIEYMLNYVPYSQKDEQRSYFDTIMSDNFMSVLDSRWTPTDQQELKCNYNYWYLYYENSEKETSDYYPSDRSDIDYKNHTVFESDDGDDTSGDEEGGEAADDKEGGEGDE